MKKRFKRLGAMLLAGTMLLGATACGGGSNSSTQEMQQNRKTVHPLRKQGERQVVVTLTHPNM